MRVSLNHIKQYIDFELPSIDKHVERINAQLGGVEEVIDLSTKYKDALIVKVVSCEKHQDADRLSVCTIDAGQAEPVQVVCGAPNVHADMWAVWLPPESIVPSTYGTTEEFKLGARELRGVMSNGMLASAKELGISDDHTGIIEIDPEEWKPSGIEIKPGVNFAKVYGLDDVIIEIENKMFTHRPDLFGQIGVAREIAGIHGKKFTSPKWYMSVPEFDKASGLDLEVFNEAHENVPRFMAVALKNVQVKPSPLWLQCALMAMGSKPINNIVDVTNYVMLLTAQPTHAYDYDKIRGHKLGARMGANGEKIKLLNGKTYELDENDIVIVDGEGPVGLAGVMGGGESEVDETTKNVILEVANFDMYTLRRTSMRHGVFTDALTRFNKGQSSLQNDRILNLLMMSLKDVSPAQQASEVFDLKSPLENKVVEVAPTFINERLGLDLKSTEIEALLQNVELECEGELKVTPPFWRTDIELPEDIVEEVGRLYGYDKLPRELPKRSTKPSPRNAMRELKASVRNSLSRAGASEVLTYSFVHENVIKKAGQDAAHAYRLSNALSPDLQYYRLSLTPSLLDKVHMNIKAGHEKFALFEINKVHYKGEMDPTEPNVPNEDTHVAAVIAYADKQRPEGAAYYQAKKYLGAILDLGQHDLVSLSDYDLTKDEWGAQLVAAYEPKRAAVILKDNQIWGVIGEYKQSVTREFKLPAYSAGFEIHTDILALPRVDYMPLSRYPSTTRDVSLEVDEGISYVATLAAFSEGLDKMSHENVRTEVSAVSIYQGEDMLHKTITLQVILTPMHETLASDQANAIVTTATDHVVKNLNARLV